MNATEARADPAQEPEENTEEQEELMISHDLFFDEGAIFGQGGAGFERINLAAPTSVIHEALERLAEARTEALES